MAFHDGWLYVAGADSSDPVRCSFRLEKRSAQDGSLVWGATDRTGGVGSLAHGIATDDTSAVDESNVFVVGLDASLLENEEQFDHQWRSEAYRK